MTLWNLLLQILSADDGDNRWQIDPNG